MNTRALVGLSATLVAAFRVVAAAGWQTADLTAFTNHTVLEQNEVAGLLPVGEQVIDGVPFHLAGSVEIPDGAGAATNRIIVPVDATFARLHLLATLAGSAPESNVVLRVRLAYADGGDATQELAFGDQLRRWDAALHKTERPLRDTNHAALAWAGQSAPLAASDRYARLYHVTLDNPHPAKAVRALTFEAPQAKCPPVIAGITLAGTEAHREPDTVELPAAPFPDLRRRTGAPAQLAGVVRTWTGEPVANATVRVVATRAFNTSSWQASRLATVSSPAAYSDAAGRFALTNLADNQLYHVVALAPGYDATFFNGADPKSATIEIRLREYRPATNSFVVRVRVVDGAGQPVVAAVAEVGGVRYAGGTSYGGPQDFPEYLATDAHGELELSRTRPFSAVQLEFAAPGLAPRKTWLDVSNVTQTVTLDVGAMVRGRVLLDGKPLANVRVGVSGVERSSEVFAGHYEATTDAAGVFSFAHLPAHISWWLHGQMGSFKNFGALRPRQFTSAGIGETNDLGDLDVGAACRLAGEVRTRDGAPLPAGLQLTLGADTYWDSQSATVDPDGRFAFDGVVPGLVEISANQNKWRFTGANRSLDNWNPWRLCGLLNEDKTDLVIEIEPGDRNYNNNNLGGQLPPADYASARPLFGAETNGPIPIVLGGTVLDDATGKPVPVFQVIPGRKPPASTLPAPTKPLLQQLVQAFHKPVTPWNELPWWDVGRTENFSNGQFRVNFQPLTSVPMLRVEAAGYEPFTSEAFPLSTNGLMVRLRTGTGPSGVVLLPDGQPAAGAKIWYAVAREQAGLTDRALSLYGSATGLKTTGADGRFAFGARPEGRTLFMAHTNGWAEVEVKPDTANLKVALAPWACVEGTLIASNGTPMAGIPLHLTHPYDWNTGDPIVNIQGGCVTDARGRFFFSNAPPVQLNLIREIRMGTGGGYSHGPQTWFICQPGVTNNLGNVTYDSPPPPPFGEKVKRALGL
ncbi:MAG TPA: hypothetical protein VFV96_07025 [Verrucomicrobiae bacterium]|nr:hypothetical protein [Verrucomicrobiae bacterium]